jgi:isopentenyl phosphate kinase
LPDLLPALGGSRGADVTGGMATKVRDMLAFAAHHPTAHVRIFSGLRPGNVERLLLGDDEAGGTVIAAE